MWSKQADMRNTNMTSLKNKITQRKRKNSKCQPAAQCIEADGNANNANQNKNKSKKKQNRKNKGKSECDSQESVQPDLLEDLCDKTLNKDDATAKTNGSATTRTFDRDLIAADVVLRSGQKAVSSSHENVSNVKRYSDSFVVFGNSDINDKPKQLELSRARSTLFVTNTESCDFNTESCDFIKNSDKGEKKYRRFSDLFRHGTLKTSSSCDNLKAKMVKEFEVLQNGEFPLRQKGNQEKKANGVKVTRNDSKVEAGKFKKPQPKPEPDKTKTKSAKEPSDHNTSYLKRVKSKIYKQRSESSQTLHTMPNIAEDVKQKRKKKDEIKAGKLLEEPEVEVRRSIPHFDFKLIRQTSNLERIRPKSFGPKKSTSNAGISELIDSAYNMLSVPVEKPLLAKSKSSSAINLNLLRSRRNKQELAKKNCTDVQDEFEFIAFGDTVSAPIMRKFGSQNLMSTLNNNNINNNWMKESGDAKPGHPVTRTGSDRRPDAVREESSKAQDNPNNSNDHLEENINSTVSLPASTGHKRATSNITRSESVKQQSEKRNKRRNTSDPLRTTTQNEIVDLSQDGSQDLSHTDSSASNSSLSSRSSDSPSTSIDAASNIPQSTPSSSVWDSDMEVEPDPPDWQRTLTEEEISSLHPHEKKRQDVINELFHTERTHVRNLKVLKHVFLERISSSKTLKHDEIKLVFSNVKELLDIHTEFNKVMKNKRKEKVINSVGDTLLNMFDGSQGEAFQKAAATFCERQQLALEFIKERRKKDSRFESVLKDCETNKECRRLPLQGIIPTEMQRLSKYPLLIERLIDHVQKLSKHNPDFNDEAVKLKQALNRSKEILNHVNDAAKQAYNRARLEDIQRHLDTMQFDRTDHPIVAEFRNLDLTRYKLLHEGSICLNRPNKAPLPVHLLILEEAVIILQKEGEKYLLKFFHTGSQSSAPILKMANVLVRPNAAEKECLFLLNSYTASVQMYDLKARDPAEMKRWFKHLSEAADAYNRREGKSNRNRCEPTPEPEEETVQELPSTREASERAESVGGNEASSTSAETESTRSESDNTTRSSEITDEERDKRLSQNDSEGKSAMGSSEVGGGASVKLAADDWPLIQPSEMQVVVPPVHRAESILTPLEKIKRKDEELRQALTEKEVLVADFLSIPREDYHTIADMASETAEGTEHDPVELALGAVFNVNKIIHAISDSLNISETDPVIATGGKYPSCASNDSLVAKKNTPPSVPVHTIKEFATTLNKQLSLLLSVVKQREEERERLKKELHRTQEQIHEQLGLHGPQSTENDEISALDCTQSGDLESIEESPTENDN